jgi:hypothetical protein
MLISKVSLAMKRSTPRAAWTFSSPRVPTLQPLPVPFNEVRCGKANSLSAALPTTPRIGTPRPPTPAMVLFASAPVGPSGSRVQPTTPSL